MVSSLLFLLLGLAGLYFGADWLVRGAVRIAAVLHVRPLFIGLTVVAFGTSAPEMVVCVVAAVQGNTDIVLGNVLGSNVANIGLILALTAILSPVQVARRLARREVPFMLVATLIFYALAWRLSIGQWEGALLVLGLVAFTRLALHWAQKDPSAMAGPPEELQQVQARRRRARVLLDLGLLTAGLLVLVIASHLLVTAAVDLARRAGVSQFIVAATLVAVGSSLPELATSIVAALRKQADIVVGNLVGSNLFNILGALGLSALVRPIRVEVAVLQFEFVALLIFSVAMAFVLRGSRRVTRAEGVVLLVAYVGFVVGLFLR